MNLKSAKILIIGQRFNNFSGGGITLTNLFKGWPKDKIAVADTGHMLFNVTTDVCNTYYQLGNEEQKWIFPFNLIQKTFPSGLIPVVTKVELPDNKSQKSIRTKLIDRFFFPFLHWIGLYHYFSGIILSQKLKDWLSEYKPEILYIQVSTREAILFIIQLCNYLKIPAAIHMMDDWPTTISQKGILRKYWRNKIDKEFRLLLDCVDLHLSISHAMTNEYSKRYNKEFIPFHNPIEVKVWMPYSKTNFSLSKEHICILYSGRIGPGITESLLEVANAIENINNGIEIKLHLQTPTKDNEILNRLKKQKCVVINPIVEYTQLPKVYSQADILLIANDFNELGSDFLKYSMPTKASEYMISGTPILVYAPKELALSKFCSENECGYCVTEQSQEKIIDAIHFLISNEEYRKKISHNAVRLATELFDADKVRKEFQQLLINIPKRENHV